MDITETATSLASICKLLHRRSRLQGSHWSIYLLRFAVCFVCIPVFGWNSLWVSPCCSFGGKTLVQISQKMSKEHVYFLSWNPHDHPPSRAWKANVAYIFISHCRRSYESFKGSESDVSVLLKMGLTSGCSRDLCW